MSENSIRTIMEDNQTPNSPELNSEPLRLGIEVGSFAIQSALLGGPNQVEGSIETLAESGYNFTATLPIRGIEEIIRKTNNNLSIGGLPLEMVGDRWITTVRGKGPERMIGLATWIIDKENRREAKDIGFTEAAFEATVDYIMFPEQTRTDQLMSDIFARNPNIWLQVEDLETAIQARKACGRHGAPQNILLEYSPRNFTVDTAIETSNNHDLPLILDLGHVRENL